MPSNPQSSSMAVLFSCSTKGRWITVSPIMLLIIIAQLVPSFAQEPGFLSYDCGGGANYTDQSTGIDWVPDIARWPDIGRWSAAAVVTPASTMADQKQYTTLRYFPSSSSKALKQSKICYNLAATAGSYYLIRASFWCGLTVPYTTRVRDRIRFRVIVDTYEDVQIDISLPQTYPWFEEMYIRAQSGSSSVSVCLSMESESSDTPFINSLELRPLPDAMHPVATIKNTNSAMRTVLREDLGAGSVDGAGPILRHPSDSLDRLWWRFQSSSNLESTKETVHVEKFDDQPPVPAMQTNLDLTTSYNISIRASSVLSASTISAGSHYYYMVLWFVELNPNVNRSGMRMFSIGVNGELLYSGIDIYANVSGLYKGYEIDTTEPLGPYEGKFVMEAAAEPGSQYPPTMAAVEILQLFDNGMNATTPTSASDVGAIQDLVTSVFPTLESFMGDPCLPQGYTYPWIACDSSNPSLPAIVTSILLSGYGLKGNIPITILSNLDQLATLNLSNNSLSGTIPDSISNLTKLKTLDLSNNNLGGAIPDSLSNLAELTYLNLANNNFNYGTIPTTLLQRQRQGQLTLIYANVGTSTIHKGPKIGIIIGVVIGAIVFSIMIIVTVRCIMRKRKNQTSNLQHHGVKVEEEEILCATNAAQQFTFQEIKHATRNFSRILGSGGFGPVYKGDLPNGVDVAIKILSNNSRQGRQEFLNEVTLLSLVHHKNLVGYVGYSIDTSLVLVYEFMPNGSLHDALSSKNGSRTLTWLERLQILSDAAQGLAYLHNGCNIIHRDVKSSNILLSQNLRGKMSDFGLSKLTSVDANTLTTRLVGTPGYLDPEYASTLNLTNKVDIFAFGVVLLEALTGQLPLLKDEETEVGNVHIVTWAKPSYERRLLETIVDVRLENKFNISSIWKVAEIAMECVQFEGAKRPTIYDVCSVLDEAIRMESNHDCSTVTTAKVSTIRVESNYESSTMTTSTELSSLDSFV